MYIVEWYDREGDLHQIAFDSLERAEQEAEYLKKQNYHYVAVIAEVTV